MATSCSLVCNGDDAASSKGIPVPEARYDNVACTVSPKSMKVSLGR